MEQCKQYSYYDRYNVTHCRVVVNKLCDQCSRDQGSEKSEAERERKREVLEGLSDSLDSVADDTSDMITRYERQPIMMAPFTSAIGAGSDIG